MSVRLENRYYDVFPRVIKADQRTTITIRPLFDHSAFLKNKTYEVMISPMEFPLTRKGKDARRFIRVRPQQGELRVTHSFEEEQEFQVVLRESGKVARKDIANFSVYALHEDLYSRRPYKGELHIHSNCSDGREAPVYVASSCRRMGLDFLALTDHHQYEPSIELQKMFRGVPTDLKIFPGEEIHADQWEVHIVNFGGAFSINKLMKNKRTFKAEVKAIEKNVTGFAHNQERYAYATCLWAYRKIEEAKGLGIFCHPNWIYNYRFNSPETLVARHVEEMPFAAYELTSAFPHDKSDTNILQVARYHEERARGKRIPVVGVTDAHNSTTQMGWGHTVVFSPGSGVRDIIKSIKDLYSVAVETFSDSTPHPHGPYRLVKYTLFLLREVFPQHDELCEEEGRQLLKYFAGEKKPATTILRAMRGQVERLYNHYWG